ncbi:hypothetical protein L1049_006150 [Liquidambar formosana]|uniref:Pectinesterase inhibitor domain-containing protein n=1 Tax=Liquidambar formosana TaxID=63359 RepID=A0AAP0RF10_LIQFO
MHAFFLFSEIGRWKLKGDFGCTYIAPKVSWVTYDECCVGVLGEYGVLRIGNDRYFTQSQPKTTNQKQEFSRFNRSSTQLAIDTQPCYHHATVFLAGNASAHGVIANLCAHTDYPNLCKSLVNEGIDATSATELVINALVLKTTHAKTSAVKLGDGGSPRSKSNLDTCKEVYDDAITNLMTSIKCLKRGDKAGLNINLSAALTDYVTCDDTFTETPGATCPLTKVNKLLRKMASNALAMASEMH